MQKLKYLKIIFLFMLPCIMLEATEAANQTTNERANSASQVRLNQTLLELVSNKSFRYLRNFGVKTALRLGADPNSRDQFSLTCLHHAAIHNNAKQIRQLVAARADINASDRCGSKPLCYAILDGKNEAANEIINQIKNQFATNTTEYLQRRNVANLTPLHLAVAFNRPEIVQRLLGLGVNPNGISCAAESIYTMTPLHYAAEISNFNLIEILLSYGANKDASDPNHGTIYDILRKKDIPYSRDCLKKLSDKFDLTKVSK